VLCPLFLAAHHRKSLAARDQNQGEFGPIRKSAGDSVTVLQQLFSQQTKSFEFKH
jgi:hypothetical protein